MPKYKRLTAGVIVNIVRHKRIAFVAPDGKQHTVFLSAKSFPEFDLANIGDRIAYIPMIPDDPIMSGEVAIRCRLIDSPPGEPPEPMPMDGMFIGNSRRLGDRAAVGLRPFDLGPFPSRDAAESHVRQLATEIGANAALNPYVTATEQGGIVRVMISGYFGLVLDGPLPSPSQWDDYALGT